MSGAVQMLGQAIDDRLRQASLVGWLLSRRRQLLIQAGHATLILGWLDDRGLAPASVAESQRIGDHVVHFDPARAAARRERL